MAKIPKKSPWNPQKAEAYVGKGVLRNGNTIPAIKGAISPVPNGHLIKTTGAFKGSTLKNGGKMATVKKYQSGGKTASTPAQKKFAALAAPKDKITFADKIAGAKAKSGKKVSKPCMNCGGKMKKK